MGKKTRGLTIKDCDTLGLGLNAETERSTNEETESKSGMECRFLATAHWCSGFDKPHQPMRRNTRRNSKWARCTREGAIRYHCNLSVKVFLKGFFFLKSPYFEKQ